MRKIRITLALFFMSTMIIYAQETKSLITPQKELKDMQTIKNNIISVSSNLNSVELKAAEKIIDELQEGGSWATIDYRSTARAQWPALNHARNVCTMAKAWSTPGHSKSKSPKLLNQIVSALKFWLKHDPKSDNWWHNNIGAPKALVLSLILIEDKVDPKLIKDFIHILKRAKIEMTGQNRIWMTKITLHRALLERNVPLIQKAANEIYKTITTKDPEGLRTDGSFFQHGQLLYSLSYGVAFVVDTSAFALEMSNTSFSMPATQFELIENCLLDGQRWMFRKQTGDYGARGRAITRRDSSLNKAMINAAENLINAGSSRQLELLEFINQLKGERDYTIKGNKHFYMSDFMTHHRPEFYSSVRMYSERVYNTDTPYNREGLKNEHVADGCNYLMLSGNEYSGIFPVWDWAKIPGTTVVQNDDGSITNQSKGNTSFVGGCSDGSYGVTSFDMKRPLLSAKKSWFFFDKQYVCLGAGITSNSKEEVVTTVNQCNLLTNVVYNFGQGINFATEKNMSFNAPGWIRQDNVVYIFPGKQDLKLHVGLQKGSWHKINHTYPEENISKNVFKLYINHGSFPQKEKYQYIVAPNCDENDIETVSSDIEILENSISQQAVRNTKLNVCGIVFYHPGKVEYKTGETISVDRACIIIIREKNKALELSISNPENESANIEITIGKDKSDFKKSFIANLPGGEAGGSTITTKIEI